MTESWKPWLVVFTVSFSISLAIVHTSISTLSEESVGGLTDTFAYVDSFYGQEVIGHWRYRVVTLGLAKLVPDQSVRLLQRQVTPFREAHLKFAFVNLGFLTATGLLLYVYLQEFFSSRWTCLFGVVIFLASRVNVQGGGAPMVDPGSFFFLLLGLYALLRRNPLLLFVALTIGVFTKETTLFLFPLLWLSTLTTREKITFSVVMLPGTVAFMLFRFVLFPDPLGSSFFNVELIQTAPQRLLSRFSPNMIIDWLSSFNLFWIPALVTLVRYPKPLLLRRWTWFIPLLVLFILLLGGNLGRILFLAFPVVIPLALIALERWLTYDATVKFPAAQSGEHAGT